MKLRWRSRHGLLCFAVLSAVTCLRIAAQTAPPSTPAGQTLQAFLEAFNSGDLSRLQAYVKEYGSPQPADGLQMFSSQTGGFDLLSIRTSAPDAITFMVKGRGDHLTAFGSLRLSSVQPPKVKSLAIRAMLPGYRLDPVELTPALRESTIQAIDAKLFEYYVYPDVAKRIAQALDERNKAGKYAALTDGNDFAEALTSDLWEMSHDKHFFVAYSPFAKPVQAGQAQQAAPTAEEKSRFRQDMLSRNCSFDKAERLQGNIGYIKLDAFEDPDVCGSTVAAAFDFLAHTDSLIFDLRENHGGDPSMVQLIVSYLFANQTHINDMLYQHEGTTRQYWTLPSVAGARYLDKPVYVLTSNQTFSGGEEFTYDLQTQKRATIVGETTGGGAHPIDGMSIGDHFLIAMPIGRPVNPITKKDWEGVGIVPDVKTSSPDALEAALKLARKQH